MSDPESHLSVLLYAVLLLLPCSGYNMMLNIINEVFHMWQWTRGRAESAVKICTMQFRRNRDPSIYSKIITDHA
jgi:hypothetical protein